MDDDDDGDGGVGDAFTRLRIQYFSLFFKGINSMNFVNANAVISL